MQVLDDFKDLKVGKSFNNSSDSSFHTIRYDFKPASIEDTGIGQMKIENGNRVTAVLPNIDGAIKTHTTYCGSQKSIPKECLLIIDHETGEITIEKLSTAIQLKKIRPTNTLGPKSAPPLNSNGNATAQLNSSKLKNINVEPVVPPTANIISPPAVLLNAGPPALKPKSSPTNLTVDSLVTNKSSNVKIDVLNEPICVSLSNNNSVNSQISKNNAAITNNSQEVVNNYKRNYRLSATTDSDENDSETANANKRDAKCVTAPLSHPRRKEGESGKKMKNNEASASELLKSSLDKRDHTLVHQDTNKPTPATSPKLVAPSSASSRSSSASSRNSRTSRSSSNSSGKSSKTSKTSKSTNSRSYHSSSSSESSSDQKNDLRPKKNSDKSTPTHDTEKNCRNIQNKDDQSNHTKESNNVNVYSNAKDNVGNFLGKRDKSKEKTVVNPTIATSKNSQTTPKSHHVPSGVGKRHAVDLDDDLKLSESDSQSDSD
ncbi:unnamed protein product [Gordionus sp. m RMFG-2023]|uniref:ell-associated factor Eaf-like n=1 Tax=Gordionus sp. m RMFG-2023 TaxID=3053472 RepID=UPI0030E2D148